MESPVVAPPQAPEPAQAAAVTGTLTAAGTAINDAVSNTPPLPADSPVEWTLLAVARRQPLAAAAVQGPSALVTTAQPVAAPGISVNPTVVLVDGVVQGSLHATSSRGFDLTY